MIKRLFSFSFFLVVVSCLIFPNSLKTLSAISLMVCFFCAVVRVRKNNGVVVMLVFWIASAIVTVSYIFVGILHRAPSEAAMQVLVIYIVFPLVWIIVLEYFLETSSLSFIVKGLLISGVVACLSVVFYYYAFLNYGADSVLFFIESPNVDIGAEGYVGATMYVFGSLIFIVGGYIASFNYFDGGKSKYLMLLLFVLVVFFSGRSALVLSLFIGILISIVSHIKKYKKVLDVVFLKNVMWLFISGMLIVLVVYSFDLKFEQIMSPLIEKILTVGGEGRTQQFDALIKGIADNSGIGSGHGVGVSYTVSDIYPWRYEMVWVASVFRVGLVGAIIYAMPFVLAIYLGFRGLIKGRLKNDEIFIFGGFLSAFVASNTNPYIEAFVFQWMYILPVLYFIKNRLRINGKSNVIAR